MIMIFLPGLQYKQTRTHHQGHSLERKCFEMGASANNREIKNTFGFEVRFEPGTTISRWNLCKMKNRLFRLKGNKYWQAS